MSGGALHQFVSAIADGANTGLARPSNWNALQYVYWDVNPQTGTSYALAASNIGTLVTFNNASAVAVSLAQANSGAITPATPGFFKGWFCFVKNLGVGAVTITPATSTINSAATYVLQQNEEAIIFSDGTNYLALRCWALSQYANSFVRWDAAQSLSAAQQLQARQNIYAAPLDGLAFNGMQVNGSMDVSQLNGASSVAMTSGLLFYPADTWISTCASASIVMVTQNVAPPGSPSFGAAFQSCIQMKATTGAALSAGDFAVFRQRIEGYRFARVGFGNAAAQPVTIGFWVYATISGTMSVALKNSAVNRSYVTNVTINNATTWEYKTVTILGDTSGTWLFTNATGGEVWFCFGAGSTFQGTANTWSASNLFGTSSTTNFFASNNNLVCVTGAIVLPGSDAPVAARSPFITRPFDQELQLARRYFQLSDNDNPTGALRGGMSGIASVASAITANYTLPVPMRSAPTQKFFNNGVSNQAFDLSTGGTVSMSSPAFGLATTTSLQTVNNVAATPFTIGHPYGFDVQLDARL